MTSLSFSQAIQNTFLHFLWLGPLAAALFGAIVGSFLGVCIERWSKEQSIVIPGSRCASCGGKLAWYDNIPILSFLLLRGCCRQCGTAFSVWHLVVEIFTALLFAVSAWLFPWPEALMSMMFVSILIVVTGIDLKTFSIPDICTMGGSVIGLLCASLVGFFEGRCPGPFIESAAGLLVGSGLVLWVSVLAEKALKKPAMGFGDILLLGMIGTFIGPQGAFVTFFLAAILGCLILLPFMAVEKLFGFKILPRSSLEALVQEDLQLIESKKEEVALSAGVAVPFGPFLALAGWLYFMLDKAELSFWRG
jgi:leader peptidase (prepilin peptidase) / N-methyltransferase